MFADREMKFGGPYTLCIREINDNDNNSQNHDIYIGAPHRAYLCTKGYWTEWISEKYP